MERYHAALMKEIETFAQQCDRKLALDTIYIGGGTPSTWPDHLLLDTFGRLKSMFNIQDQTEVTIEVNPGTVRIEQFELWKQAGINRISTGVQSLKDEALHKLNRMQSAKDVYFLLEHASKVIHNISVDFILGLPGVSAQEWKTYLQEVVTWPIKHMSMYFLMVHEQTPLYFKVKTNAVRLPKDETVVQLYYWSRELLDTHGFKQYEVSNFAQTGWESRHNTVYWDRKPYKAFGLGACSFDGTSRFQNEKNLMKYLEGASQGHDVTIFSEDLSIKQIRLERLMLGLRRAQGVTWDTVISGLSEAEIAQVSQQISMLQEKNLIVDIDGRLQLTPAGLIVENDIVARLSL